MPNETTFILPMSVHTFPRYEFVGNAGAAESGKRGDLPLHNPQRAAIKSVGAASIAAVLIFGIGWLGFYGGWTKPPGAADMLEENDVLSAKPIVMTHGVVRGPGGAGWIVTKLDSGYEPVYLAAALDGDIHGDSHDSTAKSPAGTACAGAFSDADWHPSHFGVLHVHTDHPIDDVGTTAYSGGYTASERAEACGVLEGYFTHGRILQTAKNLRCEVACDGSVPPAISEYFAAQDAWTDATVAKAEAATKSASAAAPGQTPPTSNLEADRPAATRADTTDDDEHEKDENGLGSGGMGSSVSDDLEAALWVAVGYQRRQLKGLQLGSALRAAEYARETATASKDKEESSRNDAAGTAAKSSSSTTTTTRSSGSNSNDEDRTQSFDGTYEGVDLTVGATAWDLTLINNLGDLFDVKPAVLAGQFREDFSKVLKEMEELQTEFKSNEAVNV